MESGQRIGVGLVLDTRNSMTKIREGNQHGAMGNKGLRQSREALEATWPWAEDHAGGAGGRLAQVPDTRLKGLNLGPVLHKARKWY